MSESNHIPNGTAKLQNGTSEIPNGIFIDERVYPDSLLGDFMNADYGTPEEVLVHGVGDKKALGMSKKAAQTCIRHFKTQPGLPNRALDLGCGVGRSTFELAAHFKEVLGLDYSTGFISICNFLKHHGRMDYTCTHEGDIQDAYTAIIDPNLDRKRVRFQQADAQELPDDLGKFGCIMSSMLLDRVEDPRRVLASLGNFLPSGGILVIICPYCVDDKFTSKDKWIGGFMDNKGRRVTSFDGMKQILGASFELLEEDRVPYIQRRHAHSYDFFINHLTVWRRK